MAFEIASSIVETIKQYGNSRDCNVQYNSNNVEVINTWPLAVLTNKKMELSYCIDLFLSKHVPNKVERFVRRIFGSSLSYIPSVSNGEHRKVVFASNKALSNCITGYAEPVDIRTEGWIATVSVLSMIVEVHHQTMLQHHALTHRQHESAVASFIY